MDIPILSNDAAKWEPILKQLQMNASSYDGYMQVIQAQKQMRAQKQAHMQPKPEENECICEFRAHERGGHGGLQRLRRVYSTIMRHHHIPSERLSSLLSLAGIYNHKNHIAQAYSDKKHKAHAESHTVF